MRRLFLPILAVVVLVPAWPLQQQQQVDLVGDNRRHLIATTGGSSASSSAAGNPAVVIGSANFPENEILADIYADVLKGEGRAGHNQARHRQPGGLLQGDGERDPQRSSPSTTGPSSTTSSRQLPHRPPRR